MLDIEFDRVKASMDSKEAQLKDSMNKITETLEAINLARENDYNFIISHR